MEPFESRVKVLEEEVTKLMADLRVSECKAANAEQREKDAKATQKEVEDQLRQREKDKGKERQALKDDLLCQFEARFKKVKLLFGHLFVDRGIDFD